MRERSFEEKRRRNPSLTVFLLCVILLLAAFLRFRELTTEPPGLYYDEAINGLDAISLLHEDPFQIFFTTEGHPREPLYVYMNAAAIGIAGQTKFALRGTSAVIGVITVLLLFLFIKEATGETQLALLSAFCLAVMRWHVHFSRLSFRTILTPAIILALFWMLFKARRTRNFFHYSLAGFFLGLGFYSYLSFRFVPLLVLGFFLLWHWQERLSIQKEFTRILLFVIVALVVFLPLLIDYAINPFHFFGRMKEVTLFGEGFLPGLVKVGENIWKIALMFSIKGAHEIRHNIPYMPVFDPVASLFLLVGICTAAAHIRRHVFFPFILMWLVIMLLPSILSQGAPDMLRTLAVTPVLATLLAFGLIKTVELIPEKKISPFLLRILLVVVLLLCATTEVRRYHKWEQHPEVWGKLTAHFYELAEKAAHPAFGDVTIYVDERIYIHPTFRYTIAHKPNIRTFASLDELRNIERTKEGSIFVPLIYDHGLMEYVTERYSHTEPAFVITAPEGNLAGIAFYSRN